MYNLKEFCLFQLTIVLILSLGFNTEICIKSLHARLSILLLMAGRKIKGPKVEKTADYVPDLNALDTGALSLDDIAENYVCILQFWHVFVIVVEFLLDAIKQFTFVFVVLKTPGHTLCVQY